MVLAKLTIRPKSVAIAFLHDLASILISNSKIGGRRKPTYDETKSKTNIMFFNGPRYCGVSFYWMP